MKSNFQAWFQKRKNIYSNYLFKKIHKETKIYIRSAVCCKLNKGICQLCYGWNLGNGRMAEIGETVGIIAAQSIGEPGTQLTMRTFHTGGIFSSEAENNIVSPTNGIINYEFKKGIKKILTKYREKAFLLLKPKKIKITNEKYKNYAILLPKYSIIYSSPYQKIYNKQIIAKIINWNKKALKKTEEKKEIKRNYPVKFL